MRNAMWVGRGISGMGGIPMLGTGARGLTALIKGIFRNNGQGFAYDPNDLTTLYQDVAGTIPVTGAGQPVGLMLDKSKGLALGSELITNGTFDTGIDGWNSNVATLEYSGSQLKATATASTMGSVSQAISTVSGNFYVISCEITPDLSNSVKGLGRFKIQSGGINSYTEGGLTDGVRNKVQIIVKANSAITTISVEIAKTGLWGGIGASLYIDNVSVKELAGNHAYQTDSACKPKLQRNATTGAYYLAFDGADDFLQTNNIDFTSTDKVSLFAGVRKLSDANTAFICELSTGVNLKNGTFNLAAPSELGGIKFSTDIGTTSVSQFTRWGISAAKYASPVTAVVSSKITTSTASQTGALRLNGATVNSSTVQKEGSSNFSNNPLYIGRRAGTTSPFNGHLYNLIGIARLTTDSETITLEKSIAKNTGVTL